MKKPLIILTGPTAVGKTNLSLSLAKAIGGEIISADSMQVYKYMDIGTAKIRLEEMEGIKHYLIDEFDPKEEFNIVKFQEYSLKYLDEIYTKGKIPIIVGGTGFYIQSVLYGIEFEENEADNSYREELVALANKNGADYLHQMLSEVDKKSAETIHPNNIKRVIRALEYYKQTGGRISDHNEMERQKESPYNFIYFVLNDERKILYDRINDRVDLMIKQGLVDEVKKLLGMGCTKDMVSMQGIGYKEIISFLEGNATLEEAIYIIKRDTRHFAKRQLTWFHREKEVTWIHKYEFNNNETMLLEHMLRILKTKNILN
ncbi:MAG: miaA [Lachnospiraceae bacterium]|jgi:tRNA dimethylallyltransferase|nr:miaA [Lachnospiraceae bacterium]